MLAERGCGTLGNGGEVVGELGALETQLQRGTCQPLTANEMEVVDFPLPLQPVSGGTGRVVRSLMI